MGSYTNPASFFSFSLSVRSAVCFSDTEFVGTFKRSSLNLVGSGRETSNGPLPRCATKSEDTEENNQPLKVGYEQ